MTIQALHIPHDESPMAAVKVNERNATSYYPYVQGGPVEGGCLSIGGVNFVLYVNSHYGDLEESMVNERASALFDLAGVGMLGGEVRGDALLVLGAGNGHYERSLPQEMISTFLSFDSPA